MKWIAAGILTGVLLGPCPVFAVATDSNAQRNDILNVEMPTTEEHSRPLFDFILDPQGLLYLTGAKRYDGGNVEEGATLFFHNREGQYDFSGSSGRLTITNRGKRPVTVSVSVTGFTRSPSMRMRNLRKGNAALIWMRQKGVGILKSMPSG